MKMKSLGTTILIFLFSYIVLTVSSFTINTAKHTHLKRANEHFTIKCDDNSHCNECQMNGFSPRCHDSVCYCCNSDKKCWCQK